MTLSLDRLRREQLDVHETHTALVWRAGDYALKVKKPVKTSFVDFSTLASREAACHREVTLNRRLCPDTYLGVGHLQLQPGEPLEPVVVMRWLEDDGRLDRMLDRRDPRLSSLVADIARQLAVLHWESDPSDGPDSPGGWNATAERWQGHLSDIEALGTSVTDPGTLRRVSTLVHGFIAGRRRLFDDRVTTGMVRDGHGDLRCDQIFVTDDHPLLMDCLDFDGRLRIGDVLLDAAFLAMDLEWRDRPDLAELFLRTYDQFSAERHPRSLAAFFVAERAAVRAMVAGLRSQQTGRRSADAGGLMVLAEHQLRRAMPVLVLVGGLPGSGKTTVTAGVSDVLDMATLSSDEIRKDLTRSDHTPRAATGYGHGIYGQQTTKATYSAMLHRAAELLQRGESVICDASWSAVEFRDRARRIAEQTSTVLVELECLISNAEAARRLASRTGGISDADTLIREQMSDTWSSWSSAISLDTEDADDAVLEAARHIDDAVRSFARRV